MGLCGSKGEKYRADSNVVRVNGAAHASATATDQEGELPIARVLLVGGASGGKSVLFRQLVQRYSAAGTGYSPQARSTYTPAIVSNVLLSAKLLLRHSAALHDPAHPAMHTRYAEGLEDDAAAVLAAVLPDSDVTAPDSTLPTETAPLSLAQSLAKLWADPGVQRTYALRGRFALPSSTAYFFGRLDALALPNFVPSFDDLLHVHARTVGIVQARLLLPNAVGASSREATVPVQLLDCGGRRPERSSWFHAFISDSDGEPLPTTVLFVVNLAEYDQPLAEEDPVLQTRSDEHGGVGVPTAALPGAGCGGSAEEGLLHPLSANRLMDSLALFAEVCHSHLLAAHPLPAIAAAAVPPRSPLPSTALPLPTRFVLVLNQFDLFASKLSAAASGAPGAPAPLSALFPEYDGPATDAPAASKFVEAQFRAAARQAGRVDDKTPAMQMPPIDCVTLTATEDGCMDKLLAAIKLMLPKR